MVSSPGPQIASVSRRRFRSLLKGRVRSHLRRGEAVYRYVQYGLVRTSLDEPGEVGQGVGCFRGDMGEMMSQQGALCDLIPLTPPDQALIRRLRG